MWNLRCCRRNHRPGLSAATAWLLLAAFLFALLVAVVMRLPETVNCQFVLIPATGADPIQSPRQAIISRVGVEEGQTVKLGEALFVLRSDEIRVGTRNFGPLPKIYARKKRASLERETAYGAQLEIKKAEIEQAKSEVNFARIMPARATNWSGAWKS